MATDAGVTINYPRERPKVLAGLNALNLGGSWFPVINLTEVTLDGSRPGRLEWSDRPNRKEEAAESSAPAASA